MSGAPGMQTCPYCGGAIFPPGSTVGWGGQFCYCSTQYDIQRGPQVPAQKSIGGMITVPWTDIVDRLDRIEKLLRKIV